MTRVLVCGGRDYTDREHVFAALDRLHSERAFGVLIHGAARGADALASEWAIAHNVPQLPFPADWRRFGTRAGPIRNVDMLREGMPDLVVAFPGGRGTAHMVRTAFAAGVRIIEP